MNISCRDITILDLSKIVKINESYHRENAILHDNLLDSHWANTTRAKEYLKSFIEDEKAIKALIYKIDTGEILGFGLGRIDRSDKDFIKKKYKIFYFENIVIWKTRSKGYGSELMKYMEAEARKQGCTHIELSVYATNHRAVKFYKRLGFYPSSNGFRLKLA